MIYHFAIITSPSKHKNTTSIIQLITEYLGIIKGLVTLLSGYSAIARQK